MAGCASVQGQLVGMGCELNLIFSASILCLFIPSFIAKLFRPLEISDLVALRQQGFNTGMCDAAGVHVRYRYGDIRGYTCR